MKHKAPAAESQAVKICAQSVSQTQTERKHNQHGEAEPFKLAVWSSLVLLLRWAPLHQLHQLQTGEGLFDWGKKGESWGNLQ